MSSPSLEPPPPGPSSSSPSPHMAHPPPHPAERGPSPSMMTSTSSNAGAVPPPRSYSPSRPPTSAEIDAVIAAAMANAPPPPMAPPGPDAPEVLQRSITPLMTNLMPSAVGADGRVNLFVGNLPYRVRWQDLKDLFRKAGTVLRADVSLGPDNRSRGYGTVLMGSREDAARAIDRFNGYTWQTRTLEVRPDRLPPEYEPQPHPPHRAPFGGFHGGGPVAPPFPGGGGGGGNNAGPPGWRPPSGNHPHMGPSSQAMLGVMSLPGGMHPQHPSAPMSISGTSPLPGTSPPSGIYGVQPLSGQNTGPQAFPPPPGASPLAGSLTSGSMPTIPQLPATSPVPSPSLPRPASSTDTLNAKPPTADQSHPMGSRAPPPGTLGPLPPPIFGVASPAASDQALAPKGSTNGTTKPDPHGPVPTVPLPSMEGLAHQAAGLGPPATLHDRVVFVLNMPLTMQWQELKDMLRPAGIIIRADVATDPDGRPRGFGTALFATEEDAARAVQLFNEREIGGRRLRVHLERDSLPEQFRRPSDGYSQALPPFKNVSPPNGVWNPSPAMNGNPPLSAEYSTPGASPTNTRLPWHLNTSINPHSTPSRGNSSSSDPNDSTPQFGNFRQHHPHPGPIAMPPFPSLTPLGDMQHTPNGTGGNPLSPLQTRGLPPMTPSMPGFVFNAYPETPPVHTPLHSFLGPFSPGIPVTSPTGFHYNPFLNAAPGAPVQRFNPAQQQGGSAALGTPTTQAFPNGMQRGGAQGQGQGISQALGEYFPSMAGIGEALSEPASPTISRVVGVRPKSGLAGGGEERTSLNGRDRMASTTTATNITLADGLPDPAAFSRGSKEADAAGGRSSLDESRAATLGEGLAALGAGERRASYGDIGSGRG